MTKRMLIFNPSARGEKSRRLHRLLRAATAREVTLAETTRAGQASELAAGAVADGYDQVIAAGGDGTVNEVVNGLGTSGVALGILPLGTVNVFARELGIPLAPPAAWETVVAGRTRAIDLPWAELDGQRRYFVQLAGVGLDARAVFQASWELKKLIGPLSYVWAGLKTLARQNDPVSVRLPGGEIRGAGKTVLIGNGRYYGGAFAVFPEARLDDGQLDVCIFAEDRFRDIIRYSQGVFRQVHTGFRDVQYFRGPSFECHPSATARPLVQLDGENVGRAPVRFGLEPGALRVVVP